MPATRFRALLERSTSALLRRGAPTTPPTPLDAAPEQTAPRRSSSTESETSPTPPVTAAAAAAAAAVADNSAGGEDATMPTMELPARVRPVGSASAPLRSSAANACSPRGQRSTALPPPPPVKRLSVLAAARISKLLGDNPPMGSAARVVRRQYQSLAKEREKEYALDDEELLDAVVQYEVEFPKPSASATAHDDRALGLELETDFYGRHAVVKRVKPGSVAIALADTYIKRGHVVVAVNGRDLSRLSFAEVLQELRHATPPRVIRFLDPAVMSIDELRHETVLVNRDQYGFAKDDRYILNYRRQLRKRKLASYEHERQWAAFVQQNGGLDAIDRLLHDSSDDHEHRRRVAAVRRELRPLVLKGIPAAMRPRVWSVLAHVSPYKARYPLGYYAQLVARQETSPSVADIDKDIGRTYPEHAFFQSQQGKHELRNVLTAYSLHNPQIGYCQSMNFLAGIMVLFMPEEEAFWLLCASLEPAYLPADNYAHSMVGTQTDQLMFRRLVAQELPVLAARLEQCGIQIQLITLHWFLCAFVCTLPTESALRVWDWFFLDGQEVLFVTAIGILKLAEPAILGASTHSELHTIVRELGTDLHDEDALLAFLCRIAAPLARSGREKRATESSGSEDEQRDDGSEQASQEDRDDALGEAEPRSSRRRRQRLRLELPNAVQRWLESQRKDPAHRAQTTAVGATDEYTTQFTMAEINKMRAECLQQAPTKVSALAI
ncbi:hypothetical protein ATCC90586_004390 [Pythium insidiosum]|nr:hypothetical protein ATCC90586_004390 [Pythium insidiosum]